MKYLTFGDVLLGLEDLFSARLAALQASKTGQLYAVLLKRRWEMAQHPPKSVAEENPLSAALNDADTLHNQSASRLWNTLRDVSEDASESKELQEAAARIRGDLIPKQTITRESYASKAANAKYRRELLPARQADLALFSLPGGRTLADVVETFLRAGEKLGALLSERAALTAAAEAKHAIFATVRGEVIGLLLRFRQALADELAVDLSLPRNLDAQVLGYFQQLHESRLAQRQAAAARHASRATEPPAPTA